MAQMDEFRDKQQREEMATPSHGCVEPTREGAALLRDSNGHVKRAAMHFGLGDTAVAVRPAP